MLRSLTASSSKLSLQPSRLAILVALSAIVIGVTPIQGRACAAIINAPMAAAVGLITAQLLAMGTAVTLMTTMTVDALTRVANQTTNNVADDATSEAALSDAKSAAIVASRTAVQRSVAAASFVPSRVACGEASMQRNLAQTAAFYGTRRTEMTRASTGYSLGKQGSPTEKGALASATSMYKNRCDLYADAVNMGSPSGCTGTTDPNMKDRDIQPEKSIFQNLNIETPAYQKAAADTINLLTEPVTVDQMRGQALARGDGQGVHVLRMRDLTRMNIARTVLEDMVAMRTAPDVPGLDGKKNSRFARYVELMTGEQVTGNTTARIMSAVTAAGEPDSANTQAVAARLASEKLMLSELVRMTDNLIMVESVNLAETVEQTGTRAAQVTTRPITGN